MITCYCGGSVETNYESANRVWTMNCLNCNFSYSFREVGDNPAEGDEYLTEVFRATYRKVYGMSSRPTAITDAYAKDDFSSHSAAVDKLVELSATLAGVAELLRQMKRCLCCDADEKAFSGLIVDRLAEIERVLGQRKEPKDVPTV